MSKSWALGIFLLISIGLVTASEGDLLNRLKAIQAAREETKLKRRTSLESLREPVTRVVTEIPVEVEKEDDDGHGLLDFRDRWRGVKKEFEKELNTQEEEALKKRRKSARMRRRRRLAKMAAGGGMTKKEEEQFMRLVTMAIEKHDAEVIALAKEVDKAKARKRSSVHRARNVATRDKAETEITATPRRSRKVAPPPPVDKIAEAKKLRESVMNSKEGEKREVRGKL